MDVKQNVREIFSPLGVRLGYFEYEKYLEDNLNSDVWGIDKAGFYYEDLIESLVKKVNLFDPIDIYNIASEYILRIEWLFEKINDGEFDLHAKHKRSKKKISVARKNTIIQEWVDELSYYLIHLDMMREARDGFVRKENQKKTQVNRNKIKWLGEKNQLSTLIYDLWKGQEKLPAPKTKYKLRPLIDASKEQLMTFIIENFEDSEGNAFVASSLSGILSTSKGKENEKAKGEKRIQLEYK